MNRQTIFLLLLTGFLAGFSAPSLAQETTPGSGDESSERTEESEEAYRRRMELEGARDSATYSDTSYSSQVEQEKIDKLPPESQKNIRDQITDIIIENGQWEPSDVLEDYPYQPTEAAKKDPALKEQEVEAWAEQVDKYHEREAAAFGAVRPPMPGDPGKPGGQGSEGADQQAGGPPGGAQPGQEGQQQQAGKNSTGSFDPSQSGQNRPEDEISTAGVSESALDFLRGKRGQAPVAGGGTQPTGTPGGSGTGGPEAAAQQAPALAGTGPDQQGQPEPTPQPAESTEPSNRAPDGSIPIEELDRLQGVANSQSATREPAEAEAQTQAQADTMAQLSEVTEPASETPPEQLAQVDQQAGESSDPSEQESETQQQQSSVELNLDTAGIIAIRDLEKLEGVEESEEEENP